PELLKAVPARTSTLESDVFAQVVGANHLQSYRNYARQLARPDTVIFPLDYTSIEPELSPVRHQWITAAFDAYMLNNANLEAELTALQTKLDVLDTCLADIETVPSSQSNAAEHQEYQNRVNLCVLEADPQFAN